MRKNSTQIVNAVVIMSALFLIFLSPITGLTANAAGHQMPGVDVLSYDQLDEDIGNTATDIKYQEHMQSCDGYDKKGNKKMTGECQDVAAANLARRQLKYDGVDVADSDFEYFSRYIFFLGTHYSKTNWDKEQVLKSARETKYTWEENAYFLDVEVWSALSKDYVMAFGSHKYSFEGIEAKTEKLKSYVDETNGVGVLASFHYTDEKGDHPHWFLVKENKNGDLAHIAPLKGNWNIGLGANSGKYKDMTLGYKLIPTNKETFISFEEFMTAIGQTVATPELKDNPDASQTLIKILHTLGEKITKIAEGAVVSPSIDIDMTAVPTSITAGQSFWLEGCISTSGCTISSIKAEILENGKQVGTAWVPSNATGCSSYNIGKKTNADGLAFRKLQANHSYELVITVEADSYICNQKRYPFSVR